jgi:hypothetical protein
MYKPLKFFTAIGALIFLAGFLIALRFLYFYWIGEGEGKVQSLILAAVLLLIGFQTGVFGILSDLIAANRKLNEEIVYRLRKDDREDR